MYITLEADYAVRILLYLYEQGKRCDAKTISEDTEVTLRFALKILRKLAAAGLVRSFKGFKGGYEVSLPRQSNHPIRCHPNHRRELPHQPLSGWGKWAATPAGKPPAGCAGNLPGSPKF